MPITALDHAVARAVSLPQFQIQNVQHSSLALETAAIQAKSTFVDSTDALTGAGRFCLCRRDFNRQRHLAIIDF
jgi:hypothetical protein